MKAAARDDLPISAIRDVLVGVASAQAESSPLTEAVGVGVEAAGGEGLGDPRQIALATRPLPLALLEPIVRMQSDRARPLLEEAEKSGKTWGLQTLGVDPDRYDGKGVTVAVIDTGIVRAHPAFAHMPGGAIVEADFTRKPGGEFGDSVALDTDGHGTHCAGTICGGVVNGIRIGVAPRISKLLVAKAIGGERGATALLEALEWAVAQGADVISMSLGFDFVGYQDRLVTTRRYAQQAATSMALTAFRDNIRVFDTWMALLAHRRPDGSAPLVVAATGNQSNRPDYVVEKSSPAAAENVISVGAVDKTFAIASFSNANPTFVAPGVDVISADKSTGLAVMSGTSMACPHIAGLAALYWQAARGVPGASSKRVLHLMAVSAGKHPVATPHPADMGDGMPRAPGV